MQIQGQRRGGALTVEAGVQYVVSEDAQTGYQNPPNIRGLCDGNGTMTAQPGSTARPSVFQVAWPIGVLQTAAWSFEMFGTVPTSVNSVLP